MSYNSNIMLSLTGKTAVITGGSRGIGAAVVQMFAKAGANIVFNYHQDAKAAENVAWRAGGCGVKALAVRSDLSRMKDAKRLIDTAMRQFGRLDILVANAGIWNTEDIPIEKLTEQQWDEMMDINLKSMYAVVHFAVPMMKKQGAGCIIAISSTAGQRGEAFHTHYGASKGAVISFVKGLSTELAPHRIRVNCVAPGWVETDMSAPALKKPRDRKKVHAQIPLGRVGTPDEIAGPILFLASDLAGFMTGEIVNVNGGAVLAG